MVSTSIYMTGINSKNEFLDAIHIFPTIINNHQKIAIISNENILIYIELINNLGQTLVTEEKVWLMETLSLNKSIFSSIEKQEIWPRLLYN